MNNVIKSKWVEALRSGEYKQGRGSLCKGDSYCCLGVLCEVLMKDEDAELNSLIEERLTEGVAVAYDRQTKSLPINVRLAADLSVADEFNLVCKNDSGFTFEQIAEHIEENL